MIAAGAVPLREPGVLFAPDLPPAADALLPALDPEDRSGASVIRQPAAALEEDG